MATRGFRVSLYMPNEEFYRNVQALLASAPGPKKSFSSLAVDLLQDWYAEAQHAPALLDAPPEQKRQAVLEMYARQSLELADEMRKTLAYIPPPGEED